MTCDMTSSGNIQSSCDVDEMLLNEVACIVSVVLAPSNIIGARICGLISVDFVFY